MNIFIYMGFMTYFCQSNHIQFCLSCCLVKNPDEEDVVLFMLFSEKPWWRRCLFGVWQPLTCKSFSWHCFSSTSVRSLSSSTVFCICSFSSSMAVTRLSSSCLRSDNIWICPTRAGNIIIRIHLRYSDQNIGKL